jgi:hypothetical protein
MADAHVALKISNLLSLRERIRAVRNAGVLVDEVKAAKEPTAKPAPLSQFGDWTNWDQWTDWGNTF